MRTALDVGSATAKGMVAQDTAAARALDRAAVAELGLPSVLLMENAARAVATVVHAALGDGDALVLAGKGNNGGDGLAVVRFLSPRARVALLDEPDPERSPDAALQLEVLRAAGISVALAPATGDLGQLAEGTSVLVDALLGTGLASAPRGTVAEWIRWLNGRAETVVAVDLPSGLSADTGEPFDPCVRAQETVTFARPKRGLLEGRGPEHAGRVTVATLGLPEDWVEGRDRPV